VRVPAIRQASASITKLKPIVTSQQTPSDQGATESYRGTQKGDDEMPTPVVASRHFAFPWYGPPRGVLQRPARPDFSTVG